MSLAGEVKAYSRKVLTVEYRCHMFYGQRVMDVPDGLPKWDGLNDQSNLIEDSSPELVREFERKGSEEGSKGFEKGESK